MSTKLGLLEPSPTNTLPNTCKKQDAEQLGARKIKVSDHNAIIDKSAQQEQLDYKEELVEDIDEEGKSLLSSSEDDSSSGIGKH